MTTEISYTTPCELLAQKTVSRLVTEKLIPAKFGPEILKILASGGARPEDWQLLIEKALEIEEKGALDGNNEETH